MALKTVWKTRLTDYNIIYLWLLLYKSFFGVAYKID